MTTRMFRWIDTGRMKTGWVGAGLLLLFMGSTAHAGTRSTEEVKITDSSRRAEGSLGSARASIDGNQYLACTVYSTVSGNTMACAARDTAGLFRSCTSTAPNLITAARALSSHASSARVVFTWDASYACQTLEVANGSQFRPVYDAPACVSWTDVSINNCDTYAAFAEGDPECSTKSSSVSLNISGTNGPTHMSIYNVPAYETYCSSLTGTEPGWSAVEPYAPSKLWTLSAGTGDKKVCVRLMNAAGFGTPCGGGIHVSP